VELLQEVTGGGIHALEMTEGVVETRLTVTSEPTTKFVVQAKNASIARGEPIF
jgi:hypothetical protein